MSKRRSTIVLLLLLLALLVGWWAIPTQNTSNTAPLLPILLPPPVNASGQLTMQHSVQGKTHTYSGSIPLKPCESLSNGVEVSGGNPLQVRISFVILAAPICNATTTSPGAFSVSVVDTEDKAPLVSATIGTKPVTVSVMEK